MFFHVFEASALIYTKKKQVLQYFDKDHYISLTTQKIRKRWKKISEEMNTKTKETRMFFDMP